MSFLFKSKQKTSPNPNALPAATRDIKSSDGPGSQSPALNGALHNGSKPSSPTPGHSHGHGSVNNSLNSLAGNEQTVRPGQRPPAEDKAAYMGGDGVRNSRPASPAEQKTLRERSQDGPRQRLPAQAPRPSQDSSPYPWSSRQLTFSNAQNNPFPRYGAAVNATASKEGSVYLMGGLINGSTVKGDLWMVDAAPGTMSCLPVATTSEGPGPRVGHASLLVGNAFIVFGGDTKMDEGDVLDDTLYLLNTSTKQWSRALPAGPRPPGRYGHSLNILGSKIYIFGGQVEGYFFNDLYAFDLNALQQASNKWELLIHNTIDGGPPDGQSPPARTNHTMITWGDRLYLFGGTDGVRWFNDVWSYYPHTNSWTQLECIGYIPSAREGHAAALVGDVMYIFGGRTEEGNDLGDLAAFRITSRRWYTFQNMGPSPSPRSGHSMTTVGKQIVVLAGEPSSAPRDPIELSYAYFLDTGKIRYPPDAAAQPPTRDSVQHRRPSTDKGIIPPGAVRSPSGMDNRERPGTAELNRPRTDSSSRLPQAVRSQQQLPAPVGPPPTAPAQNSRTSVAPVTSRQPTRALSPGVEAERAQSFERSGMTSPLPQPTRPPPETATPTSPSFPPTAYFDAEEGTERAQRQRPETYQPSQDTENVSRSASRAQRQGPGTEEASPDPSPGPDAMPKVRELQRESELPQDSGIGIPALSQEVGDLITELEEVQQRNVWYASELALAKKAGYQRRTPDSPGSDAPDADAFDESDKPLVDAMLKMRAELLKVRMAIDSESQQAAEKIAQLEKQRDTAISEAVYAKTKLAAHGNPPTDGGGKGTPDHERNSDMNRRLASSLAAQTELSGRIDSMMTEWEAEKRARKVAEETAEVAQKRVAELESYRQQSSNDLESVREELHEAQTKAREATVSHAEITTKHDLLVIDKNELNSRLDSALSETANHTSIMASLQEAVLASTSKADTLEQSLADERSSRDELEQKLRQLRVEHETKSLEVESVSQRLKDAQEMAEKHAEEARTHRGAVLAGLGKVTQRETDADNAADSRVRTLQQQVESANTLVRENKAAADAAFDKLRRAEERIAGLEAFQEQASREGLGIRKQLGSVMKENQGLQNHKTELEQKMESKSLEANALAVQYASLKDILGERGINASELRRSRAIDSPNSLSRFSTPDLQRVRELEQQLDVSLKSHEDMKSQFEEISERDEKLKREYEEKLTALDIDHQAAVKYLRGTEKMLSKMKQELQRVKNDNGDLKRKLEKAKDGEATPSDAPAEWETERAQLKKEIVDVQSNLESSVSDLEGRISTVQQQLTSAETELQSARNAHATSQADLISLQATHTQSRSDIDRLQKENNMLEERARDAENKVQLLLDQVESSVDNYRRQSRLNDPTATTNGIFNHDDRSDQSSTNNGNGIRSFHSRDVSDGVNSTFSVSGLGGAGDRTSTGDIRNSLALDSLASELDALRSHWESTNKSYRLSDKFDFEQRTPTTSDPRPSDEFTSWRDRLDLSDGDDVSRPTTSDGNDTVRGDESRKPSPIEMTTPAGAK